MNISIVVAVDQANGIGVRNQLPPWCIKEELRWFKAVTTSGTTNAVIMGRNTWQGCLKSKTLLGRMNVVISSFEEEVLWPFDLWVFPSLDTALIKCEELGITHVWIIGGKQLYETSLNATALVDYIYLTRIHKVFPECDTFFPKIDVSVFERRRDLEEETPQTQDFTVEVYTQRN